MTPALAQALVLTRLSTLTTIEPLTVSDLQTKRKSFAHIVTKRPASKYPAGRTIQPPEEEGHSGSFSLEFSGWLGYHLGMARTARANIGGICYHVINRGNGQAEVFHKTEDYHRFTKTMQPSASVNASLALLPVPAHDSGSRGFAIPFWYGSCIRYPGIKVVQTPQTEEPPHRRIGLGLPIRNSRRDLPHRRGNCSLPWANNRTRLRETEETESYRTSHASLRPLLGLESFMVISTPFVPAISLA